jgi:hypothetical protein
LRQCGLRLSECSFKTGAVDLEKQIAFLHLTTLFVILRCEVALDARLNAGVHRSVERTDKVVVIGTSSCLTSVTRTSGGGAGDDTFRPQPLNASANSTASDAHRGSEAECPAWSVQS